MKFKKIIVLIFFFVLLCICFYNFNLCKIKISIEVKNISASNIEKYLTCDLIKEFLKIRQIRDFVAFSKDNSCSVYCKIYPFVSSYSVIEKIETKLKLLNSEILKEAKISIDYDFDTKYDSFLVISSEFASYPTLMDCCDKIENLLLNMRLAKKILKMGKQQKAVYVYFDDSDLIKYNLSIEDIKQIILKNNLLNTNFKKTIQGNSYSDDVFSVFENSFDVSEVVFELKDKLSAQKLSDAFNVVEDIKTPFEHLIKYNNKKALVLAISNKNFLSKLYLNYKIKNIINDFKKEYQSLDIELLNASNFSKITLPFDSNVNVCNDDKLINKLNSILKQENINDYLFFVGIDSPKISSDFEFFEKDENKIVVLFDKNKSKKIKKILKREGFLFFQKSKKEVLSNSLDELYKTIEANNKVNFFVAKKMKIKRKIDNFSLFDYKISKQDVLNSIISRNEGVYCTEFYDKNYDAVEIVLKNKSKDSENYIYSKDNKALIPLSAVSGNELREDFKVIAHKNNLYFLKIYK